MGISDLKDKLRGTHLHDAKISLVHKKHQIGKFANLFNADHRHDEEHEKACDEKRTAICESHRYQSYFPQREGNLVKWYVDGRDYFWAVSAALEQARETIYIADWWLSPELFLRRPPHENQEWRLDRILKRRAEAGVKIFVCVYREVEAALTCNSQHTKHALQALCPEGTPGYGNITVMRHPDHNVLENAADMTFYWAHHEKFIVIDYAMAFIGGLDMCFGRWDAHQHALSDVHPEGVANEVWPGQDFNNNRVLDFKNVQDWKQNELDKKEYGRMPWHDVSMGIIGPAIYDIAEHFVLRWNFVKRDKYKRDDRFDWLMLQGREGEDEDLVGVQRPKHPVGNYVLHPLSPYESKNLENRGTVSCQIVRSSADWSSGILTEHSIQNAYADIIRKAEHFVYIENQFFITATGEDQSPIHNTIGGAIVDAVVRAHQEQRKFRIIIIIPAVPGFAGDLRDDAATGTRAIMDYQYKSICRGEHSIYEKLRAQDIDPYKYIFFFNLRSYDRLNITPAIKKAEKETGIKYQQVQRAEAEEIMQEGIHGTSERARGHTHTAKLRQKKKKFHRDDDSSDGDDDADEHDEEAAQQAFRDREKFEAAKQRYLDEEEQNRRDAQGNHPEGEYNPKKPASYTVAHHAMAGTGPVSEETWDDPDPESEVQHWIQEELYIHSKLLIADDRIVVCGSSNLNDRSQLGDHDSELSIVMEDTRTVTSRMDGREYTAGWHATSLRRQLWREHMGLLPPQDLDGSNDVNAQPPGSGDNNAGEDSDAWRLVEDPLSDELWDKWTEQASTNTMLFRHLFHADPDDHVKTFDDYHRYLPPSGVKAGHIFDQFIPPDEIRAKLDQIKGHLVWMPMLFLRDAEMAEKGLQVNQFTESVYT